MAARLNPQQMDDMRAAYRACLDGEIPDWRYGFFRFTGFSIGKSPAPLHKLVSNSSK